MDDGCAVHDCWDGDGYGRAVHHYMLMSRPSLHVVAFVVADGQRHSVAALPHFRPTPYIILCCTHTA
eukprot:scaffold57928_cov69-Attheya_sp.AAC.2